MQIVALEQVKQGLTQIVQTLAELYIPLGQVLRHVPL